MSEIDEQSAKEQARLAAIAWVKKYKQDLWSDGGNHGRDHVQTFLAGVEWKEAQLKNAEVVESQ